MHRRALMFACAALALSSTNLSAQTRVEAGILECTSVGGTAFVIGSVRDLSCVFRSVEGGPMERYTGTVRRFGIDIGQAQSTVMLWTVLAPTRQPGRGDLAGTYGGLSAEAAIGVGLGANAMVGGSNRTIALQPLSIAATTGFNIATGVAELELRAAP